MRSCVEKMDLMELEDLDKVLQEIGDFPAIGDGVPKYNAYPNHVELGYAHDDEMLQFCASLSPRLGPNSLTTVLDDTKNLYLPPPTPVVGDGSNAVNINNNNNSSSSSAGNTTTASKSSTVPQKCWSRERKSFREKQRRQLMNERFNALSACLELNSKRERADIVQMAIDTIESLRAKNKQMQQQIYLLKAQAMVEKITKETANVSVLAGNKRKSTQVVVDECPEGSCGPMMSSKTTKANTTKRRKLKPKILPRIETTKSRSGKEVSSAKNNNSDDQLDSLPQMSIIAAALYLQSQKQQQSQDEQQQQLHQAGGGDTRQAENITHSHCA